LSQTGAPPAFDLPDWLQAYQPTCYAEHVENIVSDSKTVYRCSALSGDDDASVAVHQMEVNSGQNPPPLLRPLADSDAAGFADAIGQCLGVPVQKIALSGGNEYQLTARQTTISVFAEESDGDHELRLNFTTPD
jgi:hypothetical protein